jgi:hypothetical protein
MLYEFIQKKGKNISYAKYSPVMDVILENFKETRTVRKLKGYLFIQNVSFSYAMELMYKSGLSYSVRTKF